MKNIESIDPKKLKQLLDDNAVTLIDVREPAEHRSEHIAGAHLIPLSQLSLDQLPSTARPIVIHCSAGVRSLEACKKLHALDTHLKLFSLEGGLHAWKHSGFPIQRGTHYVLPLDRQTQLIIGLLNLLGIGLGFGVHPYFFLINVILGLGLMNAGLTGWCGMAKIIARMPWNQS
jgi:rhodanese-related sulfurtransferase